MKLLLVFLVFFLCSYSSNAQMQDEGTTVTATSETEIQGDLEVTTTVTTTTVIDNENTGAILSSGSTGIVAEKYEGDMDIDWGGAGSIYSHTSCNGKLGEYTGSNTCAAARNNSLTTWRQTVDLDQFSIDDGGQVRWEMRFGMEPSMYNNSSRQAYVELKGYDDGAVQWTDVYDVDKSTFALNSNGNYLAPNGFINNNLDYAGGLDSLYINIGGYGEYMFDSVWFDVYYNEITTTVAESIVYNLIEQEIQNTTNTIIDTNYDYGADDFNDNSLPDTGGIDMPDVMNDDYGPTTDIDDMSTDTYDNTAVTTQTITVFSEIETSPAAPDIMTSSDTGANVDQMFSNITSNIDPEEISSIQVMVADLQNIDIEPTSTNNITETTTEIEPPPIESEVTNETPTNANMQTTTTETTEVENESTSEMDSSQDTSENEVEVIKTQDNETEETAENNTEEPTEEVTEEPTEEPKAEKEVVEKEIEEDSVEEKVEVEEKTEKEVVEEKQEKQKEAKQEKAKKIMANFDSQYDALAQITTLALVNALGPNMKTYNTQPIGQPLTWYEPEEIYSDVIMPDPLGAYFGVRDSLVFEKMIGQQYE